jgi:pyruvate/2-oxoglutarate dehydrogenase complex dihydrolipoamide dehydrogenase (E3) component
VADPSSGKLLGAQIIGLQGAAQRINIITALLRTGATVDDLYNVDFVYSPRLAPAHDAMMIAARMMQKRLIGKR